MRKTLLDMISLEAKRTFPMDLVVGQSSNDGAGGGSHHTNFEEVWTLWVSHWIKTATKIHERFMQEGLPETAKAIQEHIDWAKTWK